MWFRKPFWSCASPLTLPLTRAAMQRLLTDMWLLRAAGFWNSLMTGSAFHKAMAQDAVQLKQVTGTKGWVAGLSKALQIAGFACQPQQLQGMDIGRLQVLLRDGRQRVWDDLDVCPRTVPLQGARQCTYERWFRKPSWAAAAPTDITSHSRSYAAVLEVSYWVSWVLAASLACLDIRGCASSVAPVLVMRCTWSLSVQQWQICVAGLQICLRHIRRCSSSCSSQICCVLPKS